MATIEEIVGLEHGAGRSQADVQQLINQLRQKQTEAEAKDKDTLNTIQGVGKTAINFHKLRKDFLLAKRANPNLTLKEFFADDKVSAEYIKRGVDMVVNKEVPNVSLKEILGFDKDRYMTDDALKNKIAPYQNTISEEQFIPQDVSVPEFNADKMIEQSTAGDFVSPPIQKPVPLNKNLMQGVQPPKTLQEMKIDHLNKYGKLPENSIIGYNKPENLEFLTRKNPQMLEEVLATPTSVLDSSTAIESASTATDSASAAADSASAASSAGLDALGTAGSALELASSTFGEEGMFTDALTPKNYLNTAGSIASILSKTVPGLQPLGIVGAGAKGLSRLLG
tara:strand:+ start:20 stop:1033 length:1014 start_codon:yes stop_codon:yes gene_type:complete